MRTSVLPSLLLLCTATSAWLSFPESNEIVHRGREMLGIRDDSSSTSQISTSVTNSASVTSSNSDSKSSDSGSSNSASITTSQSGSNSNSSRTTTKPTQSTFDPRDGPGGISMISPNPTLGATYYKIKDPITFAWNYTSVSIYPTAVDILAVGQSNHATWTLALNQTVPGPSQTFTWDSGDYQSSATPRLSIQSYTLVVHDSNKDVTAIPSAGYLGTANQFVFGMYVPQQYTPWAQWTCATCSAADAQMERRTVGFVFGMAAITVLTFTWFSGVAGLW